MEFTFLGTSSGVPSLQRNVSGLVIKPKNSKSWCLVDCGEGTQQQLLRTPFSLPSLQAIFITHVHGDHTYGLPGLLASASMAGRRDPLTIVGPPGVEDFIRAAIRYTDVYQNYELRFKQPDDDLSEVAANEFSIDAHPLSHRVPSFAYAFSSIVCGRKLDAEKLRKAEIPEGPLWGEIAKGKNITLANGDMLNAGEFLLDPPPVQKIIIAGDNDTPSLLSEAAKNAEVLVHEATYTQAIRDKVGPGPQHSSAKLVASFAEEAAIPNLVLTHFSARYHRPSREGLSSLTDIENEARAHYSARLFLAEDFANYVLNADGVLTQSMNNKP